MIAYLLICIAAVMNAVMDRTENKVAFNRSVFAYADEKFWCKEVSWQYAVIIFKWKADAWHIAKSLMIIFLAVAMICFESIGKWWVDLILIGTIWNITFNVFYHKFLHR